MTTHSAPPQSDPVAAILDDQRRRGLTAIVERWPSDTLHTHDGHPYMRRYYPLGPGTDTINGTTVRIHQFLASDPGRDLHDHPWDFTTTILAGTYLEHHTTGTRELHPGDTTTHAAEDAHRVELIHGPVWTLFTHGPARRRWGFHTPTGWTHWRDYPHAGQVR